ncbi:MAG: transposase [Candidatus Paceibacterota bacterium]|jgi:putative transposase
MTRPINIAPDEFYHIYNRGIEKRKVFLLRSDYERFTALLYLANQTEPADLKYQGRSIAEITNDRSGEPLVEIIAYCLMPNHFHLLLREKIEGNIARFMQKLTTGYTMYFNKRNERNGALFQGTYKASHVHDDRYFRYVISYIHLNPVKLIDPIWKKNGIKDNVQAEKYLSQYVYSSYKDYLGETRSYGRLLEQGTMKEIFPNAGDFHECVTEWLTYPAK